MLVQAFLIMAKVVQFFILILIGSETIPKLLITHMLHGPPFYFLIGWVTEPLFFRLLHQVRKQRLSKKSRAGKI